TTLFRSIPFSSVEQCPKTLAHVGCARPKGHVREIRDEAARIAVERARCDPPAHVAFLDAVASRGSRSAEAEDIDPGTRRGHRVDQAARIDVLAVVFRRWVRRSDPEAAHPSSVRARANRRTAP